ncbi:hypothetical protein V6235_10795 [Vibrio metschnikovii]|uniref:hypothetical protein n=1 Tax=Vibrio metschnikovii TaxID=28172 RepID=UPI00130299A2|nr:hypothetical protein [Vibrio metschnikovii]
MKKLITFMTILLMSFSTSAEIYTDNGTKWYGPYTIKSVARYIQGNKVHRVSILFNEPIDTTCELNNSTRRATNVSTENILVDAVYSGALAAQAQNKPVRILLTGACSATHGLDLYGIDVVN